MIGNRFNLVEEAWIPIQGRGLMSLKEVFTKEDTPHPAGSPIQKIALFKFLLALCQASLTPKDEKEWESLSPEKLAKSVAEYLEQKKQLFWLYGEKPFLQFPAVAQAKINSYGAFNPEIATGNTTILLQSQIEDGLSDAQKACLLITLQGFATGGKKVDNSIVLSPGVNKKKGASFGPSLGFLGFLHTLGLGRNLWETLWINLFTSQKIKAMKVYTGGIGTPPWEKMPQGEEDAVAEALSSSLMGRLIPLSRFCLLDAKGIHITEGIRHQGYKEGVFDPTVSVNQGTKDSKAIWANPDRRPWRSLTAMLSFLQGVRADAFVCHQLQLVISRSRHLDTVRVWSGGIRVSSNAGEQFPSGSDDYVESIQDIQSEIIGEVWFQRFSREMEKLEGLEKGLYAAVCGYFAEIGAEDIQQQMAAKATNVFWQKAEKFSNELINNCGPLGSAESITRLRTQFSHIAQNTYDQTCPHGTPRQFEAWVKHSVRTGKYVKED